MSNSLVNQSIPTGSNIKIARPLSIFEEMDRLMQKIENRAFSLFQERGSTDGFALNDWFRAESEMVKAAPIEMEEKDNEVIVRAEVPGFETKELSIRADAQNLSIYGKVEKKTEPTKKQHYSEISTNEVFRNISLPVNVDPDKATARLDKGVLEIRLPKAAAPKLVEIKPAG